MARWPSPVCASGRPATFAQGTVEILPRPRDVPFLERGEPALRVPHRHAQIAFFDVACREGGQRAENNDRDTDEDAHDRTDLYTSKTVRLVLDERPLALRLANRDPRAEESRRDQDGGQDREPCDRPCNLAQASRRGGAPRGRLGATSSSAASPTPTERRAEAA